MTWPLADAPGAVIAPQASVPHDVVADVGVVVHGSTRLGHHVRIGQRVVLGKPGHDGAIEPLVVGDHASIGAETILFAGVEVGQAAMLDERCFVREGSVIGERATLERNVSLEADVVIGPDSKIGSNTNLTSGTVVGAHVHIDASVVTTNDNTMGRHAKGEPLSPPRFDERSRIGDHVVVLPGITVGRGATVLPNSVVTDDVEAGSVVGGVPAHVVNTPGEPPIIASDP